ncbi:MAG: hypothetical protein ACE5I1_30865 [bacterium]
MKTKLNCVVMKHKGAEKIQEKIAGLSITEELKLWQEWSIVLRKRKENLMHKQNLHEATP